MPPGPVQDEPISRRDMAAAARCRRAGMGGATLLVLVTLVLATGHRAVSVDRHSMSESRWSEPTTARNVRTVENRTEPAGAKRACGPSRPRQVWSESDHGRIAADRWAHLARERCPREVLSVRDALSDLPPPLA
ncbi:MAG: hypothetical protein KF869_10360 [Phycisphaeraceae bacterium]|nr:hypothetical protein [Phycisphaeraceae bacterium]